MSVAEVSDVDVRVQRAKGSAHYRSLELPLHRAVWLHLEHGITQRRAALEEGVSRSSLQRALTAEAEKREIGQNGRPKLLNSELEMQLKHTIVRRSSSLDSMSLDEIRTRVWTSVSMFEIEMGLTLGISRLPHYLPQI